MSAFTESQHPRATAGLAEGGQFVTKLRPEADVTLASPALQIPDDVSDECRRTLAILAPMGLRGRVEEEAPRHDRWTWFTIHNGDDELRIGAHWDAAREGVPDESSSLSLVVDLSCPNGEPDHAGSYSSTSLAFAGDAQATVRKTVLAAAMQEEAAQRWPDLAGYDLGRRPPLFVGAEASRRQWRTASDPEPPLEPGARLLTDDGCGILVRTNDGQLEITADGVGGMLTHPYLRQVVLADVAARLHLCESPVDASDAVQAWLSDAQTRAYDSPVYHRFFG